jgi:hypothetical protein
VLRHPFSLCVLTELGSHHKDLLNDYIVLYMLMTIQHADSPCCRYVSQSVGSVPFDVRSGQNNSVTGKDSCFVSTNIFFILVYYIVASCCTFHSITISSPFSLFLMLHHCVPANVTCFYIIMIITWGHAVA